MPINAAQLQVKIGADTAGAEAGFGKIKAFMSPQSALLLGAGAVAGAFVGIGVASVKMAGDFQAGMTSLVTGAGEAAGPNGIGLVSAGILQLARDTGTSTDQLTAGMYMIESAGYHGKAGLDVLKAAAQGAKVGQADLGVTADALTTILNDYPKTVNGASGAMNALIATVASGKTHMQDLAGALSNVLPTAAASKVGLNDVMAAMATMTSEGVPAADAATYLRQTLIALDAPGSQAKKTLASIGLKASDVSAEMQKSLPDALKMITDALAKKFPVGSAAYVAALKDIAGGSKQMQGMLDLTGDHMKTFQSDLGGIGGAVTKAGHSIQGWGDVQGDFNQKMSQLQQTINTLLIGLGQRLLPVVTQVAGALANGLNWAVSHAQQIWQQFYPVIIGAAGAIGGALVAALYVAAVALWATLAPVLAFIAPFVAVGAAIALVVVGFKKLYDSSAPFRAVVNALVTAVKGEFLDIWHQLVSLWQSDLLPAFKQVQAAFQQALPVLEVVGAIIGGVLVVALGLLIGVIRGLVAGIAVFIAGFAQAFAGIIQIVSGFVKLFLDYWGGLFAMLKDVFTGNWSQLGKDAHTFLNNMVNDIGQILGGLVNLVGGLLKMLIGAPLAQIKGFVDGVIGFFTHLFESLVGHSIVPDLIRGIIGAFTGLPGKVLGIVGGLVSGVIGHFVSLVTGTNHQMQLMHDQAAMKANATKIAVLTKAEETHLKAAASYGAMRQKIVAELAQTTNPAKRHALETQLAVVTAAQHTQEEAAHHIEELKIQAEAHYKAMAADAKKQSSAMHDGVLGVLADLPGKALSVIGGLASNLANFFGGLAHTALSWGGNIIAGITSGITGALGGLASAVKNGVGGALSGVKNTLHGWHIPGFATGGTMGDTGLAIVGEQGPELVKLPGGSQVAPIPNAGALVSGAGVSGLPAGMSAVYGLARGTSGANGQPILLNVYLDGMQIARIVTKHQPTVIRNATGARNF